MEEIPGTVLCNKKESNKWCKKTMFSAEKDGKSGNKRSNSLYLND